MSLGAREKAPSRKNSNLSSEIEGINNPPASPSLGSNVPKSKDNRGNHDTGSAKHVVQTVFDAVSDEGTVKKAHEAQNGKAMDNMPQQNGGCDKK